MKHTLSKRLFLQLLTGLKEGFLELVCPEETYNFGSPQAELRAMIVVHDEGFYRRALFGADVGMGEAFMDGDWSAPDLVALVRLAVRNLDAVENGSKLFSAISSVVDTVRHRLRGNTLSGSRRNISYHYDLGNDFYGLFLDSSMAYSCGCFQSLHDSLEQAQLNKYEIICRKLNLKASDHLLEIGTGWGGFAAYAVKKYGCRITTTTISRRQHDYAKEVFTGIDPAGDRINLLLEDYRNLRGQFDKIVSIEMFEAVGLRFYDTYFGACDRLLKPDGTMVLQTITINDQKFPVYRKRCDWIQKYIFPGSELASVSEVLRSLARCTGLSHSHAEDIGLHYAETLKHWRERFTLRLEDVKELGFDERFLRMWEYYLGYCEGAFRERHVGDMQLVLTKQRTAMPLAISVLDRKAAGVIS
ncbi:MAG: class I SAM-dependent methyltransferase [Terracidiphilus sp.]